MFVCVCVLVVCLIFYFCCCVCLLFMCLCFFFFFSSLCACLLFSCFYDSCCLCDVCSDRAYACVALLAVHPFRACGLAPLHLNMLSRVPRRTTQRRITNRQRTRRAKGGTQCEPNGTMETEGGACSSLDTCCVGPLGLC